MSNKDNYIVAHVREPDNSPRTFIQMAGGFESTRDALKWVKVYGEDEVPYSVLKITKNVEVETVSNKRVLERSSKE